MSTRAADPPTPPPTGLWHETAGHRWFIARNVLTARRALITRLFVSGRGYVSVYHRSPVGDHQAIYREIEAAIRLQPPGPAPGL